MSRNAHRLAFRRAAAGPVADDEGAAIASSRRPAARSRRRMVQTPKSVGFPARPTTGRCPTTTSPAASAAFWTRRRLTCRPPSHTTKVPVGAMTSTAALQRPRFRRGTRSAHRRTARKRGTRRNCGGAGLVLGNVKVRRRARDERRAPRAGRRRAQVAVEHGARRAVVCHRAARQICRVCLRLDPAHRIVGPLPCIATLPSEARSPRHSPGRRG